MPLRSYQHSENRYRSLLIAIAVSTLPLLLVADQGSEFFESRIRPVLIESCFECHSGDSKRIGGQLRLDSREGILRGGELGPAVVIGKPDASLLIKAIEHVDQDLRMPKRGERLGGSSIEDFKRWIKDGLVWSSQLPPERGDQATPQGFDLARRKARLPWIWTVPERQSLPPLKNQDWPQTEIDYFILADLETAGISPNRDANPAIWLRRASQALLGLPPSESLQDQFAAMPPERAYSFAVDQMLASPRFGERWARHWMDLVRYAESRGHESDFIIANAYHYRDYLIRALNQDLPYDQFVIEQLAGDLLSPARRSFQSDANESILGTAWAFLGEEVHSPVDIRQDECDRLDNKVDVLSKTFLGLTVACARCHDHKFDAISQEDYYAMSGFFLSSNFQQVRFETQLQNDAINRQLRAIRKRFQKQAWQSLLESSDLSSLPLPPPQSEPPATVGTGGRAIVQFGPDGLKGATLQGPGLTLVNRGSRFPSRVGNPYKVELAPVDSVRRDPRWNRLRLSAGNQTDSGSLDAVSRANGMLKTHRFRITSGQLRYLIKGKVKVYAAVDSHLMVAGPLHGSLVKTFETQDPIVAEWVEHDLSAYRGHLMHLEFGTIKDSPLEIVAVIEDGDDSDPVHQIEALPAMPITAEQCRQAVLEMTEKSYQWDALGSKDKAALIAVATHLANHPERTPAPFKQIVDQWMTAETFLMRDARFDSLTAVALSDNNGLDESVLIRGNPTRPSQVARRRLPEAFETQPVVHPRSSGRYELATAIASAQNPLTARVIVNRVWHHVFGRGIVPTVDNFGYLGERPSHPELLDHLAFRFTHDDQWSIKRLLRRILLSRTYRLSSRISPRVGDDPDPSNQFYARFPIRRLEAEAIRDNVLAVSGRLDTAMFGPSIPVHLTDFVIGRGRPNESGPLDGEGRRSVYIAVRRNFLPTLMTAFDFPTPFSTIGKRNVTNVPAQSLALSNDAFMHAQARNWASDLLGSSALTEQDRIEQAFRIAFARPPTVTEMKLCLESLAAFRTIDSDGATELEAWTALLHSVLSMNEFIYIR